MQKSSPELKVGILTVIAIIVLIAGTFFIGKFQWFQKTYSMEVYFDFVSGLQEGAPVRLNGVRVGSVKIITIRPDVTPPIVVTLQLSSSAKMHKDARVFVNTLGLMGEKYIEIYAGSASEPFLKQGEPLIGQSPTELQDVLNASKVVADNLAKTMEAFAEVFTEESTRHSMRNFMLRLDSISRNIDATISNQKDDYETFAKNLKDLSDNMKSVTQDINNIISDNRGDIKKITSNMADASETIQKHSSRISENLEIITERLRGTTDKGAPDLEDTLKNFKDASENFKESMRKLELITSRIERGEGTVGKLVSDDELYSKTTETMSKIQEVATTVSSGGKFFGGIQFQYELRYRDSLSRWRNDIHIRITPSNEKYYLMGASDIGRDVGLDLLYARREGPMDIKLGILESEAAVGIDYHLIKNRLALGVLGVGLTERSTRVDLFGELFLGNFMDVDWYFLAGGEDVGDDVKGNAGVQIRY